MRFSAYPPRIPGEMEEVKVPYRNSRLFSGAFLTERLIDQIVYRLYGLTEEEIGIVEEQG